MIKLKIITSTVRPSRKGPLVASWILELARESKKFEVELLDLAEIGLPHMNEANHPVMRKYEHPHTRDWSAKINDADAFIFVSAEYDHGYPAPLRNALEYLYHEWNYKVAGLVTYGGISGGMRAGKQLMGDLASFKMVGLVESVHLPFFTKNIGEDEIFHPEEASVAAAQTMFSAIERWEKGLALVRQA